MDYLYERLSDDIKLAVSKEHTFGTDAVLLSYFSFPKYKDISLDMGTGCGIIPFLWLRDKDIKNVHCLDIQKNAFDMVKHSISLNALENRIEVKNVDLKEIKDYYEAESFTLVTMNPPYKPLNTGIESTASSAKIARHETECSNDDVISAASYLLKFGGRFCMCQRPERLVDVLECMRKYKLEPKRLRFVQDKDGVKPFLFLVEGKKGSKPFLQVEQPLIIKKENGKFTDEMIEVYGSYADGYDR